ncbi:MAG: hypothetical protein ACPGIA_09275 [Luteolibacter sp.]
MNVIRLKKDNGAVSGMGDLVGLFRKFYQPQLKLNIRSGQYSAPQIPAKIITNWSDWGVFLPIHGFLACYEGLSPCQSGHDD